MKSTAITLAAVLATAASAYAMEPAKVMDSSAGKIWTDEKGMTLYTYDKDEKGKTNCYDKCATNWPPLKAEAGAKADDEWSVVDRTDGTKMWAYDGKPVYTYVKDTKKGDMTGEGVGGVWHTAKAD